MDLQSPPSSFIPLCVCCSLNPAELHHCLHLASMACAHHNHAFLHNTSALDYKVTSYLQLGADADWRINLNNPVLVIRGRVGSTENVEISNSRLTPNTTSNLADALFRSCIEILPRICMLVSGQILFAFEPNLDYLPWHVRARNCWVVSCAMPDPIFTTRVHIRITLLGSAPYRIATGDLFCFTFRICRGVDTMKFACGATAGGDLNFLVEGVTWMDVAFILKHDIFIV
jgi:hypothetical protein